MREEREAKGRRRKGSTPLSMTWTIRVESAVVLSRWSMLRMVAKSEFVLCRNASVCKSTLNEESERVCSSLPHPTSTPHRPSPSLSPPLPSSPILSPPFPSSPLPSPPLSSSLLLSPSLPFSPLSHT